MSKKVKTVSPSKLLADVIVEAIQEVKGNEIRVLDLTEADGAVCNYFVICHGDSNTQVEAIARSVEKYTSKQLQEKPWHVEGRENAEWILMDFVDVVVHVFYREAREFYNIEGLWADAPVERIEYQV